MIYEVTVEKAYADSTLNTKTGKWNDVILIVMWSISRHLFLGIGVSRMDLNVVLVDLTFPSTYYYHNQIEIVSLFLFFCGGGRHQWSI